MLSRIRSRFTYANLAATLALLFAMSGGAYAASRYLITSTKQISPKVLKSLKGAKGPAGATGPSGSTGAAGPAGPAGTEGAAGKEGATGKEGTAGKEGKPGKDGPPGEEGSPWTAGGTLPEGSTETGAWVVQATNKAEGEFKLTAISFPIPLQAETSSTIFVKAGAPTPEGCSGNAEKPGAVSGHLCIFEAETLVHKGGLTYSAITNPKGNFEAGTTGGELIFATGEPTTPGEEVTAEGSWAVTG